MAEFDTNCTDEITCPYCGHVFSDSWEYNDQNSTEQECHSCGKTFFLEVDFKVTYTTDKMEKEEDDNEEGED